MACLPVNHQDNETRTALFVFPALFSPSFPPSLPPSVSSSLSFHSFPSCLSPSSSLPATLVNYFPVSLPCPLSHLLTLILPSLRPSVPKHLHYLLPSFLPSLSPFNVKSIFPSSFPSSFIFLPSNLFYSSHSFSSSLYSSSLPIPLLWHHSPNSCLPLASI